MNYIFKLYVYYFFSIIESIFRSCTRMVDSTFSTAFLMRWCMLFSVNFLFLYKKSVMRYVS